MLGSVNQVVQHVTPISPLENSDAFNPSWRHFLLHGGHGHRTFLRYCAVSRSARHLLVRPRRRAESRRSIALGLRSREAMIAVSVARAAVVATNDKAIDGAHYW